MKLAASIIFFFLFSLLSHGENIHNHEAKKDNLGRVNTGVVSAGVESLSPALRGLLTKEMLALQNGMIAIIPAYISGNWRQIENIAQEMENSYILKKNITDEQIKELHSSLPESFLRLDQQFHYLSGMLSHAAKNKKPELVGFYFSKLGESCVGCHREHATGKFPAFLNNTTNPHQH